MPLGGKTLMPREIGELGYDHYWTDPVELAKMIATCLGESQGSIGAWHDNLDGRGNVMSRDCGIAQINIPADEIGTTIEQGLRTMSKNKADWLPVVNENVAAMARLYSSPWVGGRLRRWQPWFAYTFGWATFPEWWIWHQENGKAIGPWMKTGRYIQRAIPGVANFHLLIKNDMNGKQALALAQTLQSHFGVQGKLGLVAPAKGVGPSTVEWTQIPGEPSAPPADGIGPRPHPNNGT